MGWASGNAVGPYPSAFKDPSKLTGIVSHFSTSHASPVRQVEEVLSTQASKDSILTPEWLMRCTLEVLQVSSCLRWSEWMLAHRCMAKIGGYTIEPSSPH